MLLQYKKRKEDSKWKDYHGRKHIDGNPQDYKFRLLNKDNNKIVMAEGNYEKILKKHKEIEFSRRRKKTKKLLKILDAVIE